MLPVLRSLCTGTPAHQVAQQEIREVARALFPRHAARQTLLNTFNNAFIDFRFLARPLDWYREPHSFGEKNAVFVEQARALLLKLSAAALAQAEVKPGEIDAVIVVTNSGLSTPSLDAYLIGALGLNPHALRLPIWGLGCAGGVSGLARAAELIRAGYQRVLYVAAEFCSLTLVAGDQSKSNFVGTALFGDGGAALVVTSEDVAGPPPLLALHGSYSTLIENSEDIMGWEVVDDGLKVRFSRDIPALVHAIMNQNVNEALGTLGWTKQDLTHYVVHPGGAKVLAAYEQALSLPEGTLNLSREVLRQFGNMSSVTVLFVLQAALRQSSAGKTMISAMGPGFSAEHVLAEIL